VNLFATHWNGASFFTDICPNYEIHSDVSGSWEFGAVFGTQWIQLAWSNKWLKIDIVAKELLPIVLSCVVWGPVLSGYTVESKCDNQNVVVSVNKGSSKEPMTMHLLRCLWFFSTYFGITVTVSHIPGVVNVAIDQLSRNKSAEFLQANPYIFSILVTIPTPLLKLLSPQMQDWTSLSFAQHFK